MKASKVGQKVILFLVSFHCSSHVSQFQQPLPMAEIGRHKQRRIHQFHRCDFIKKTSSQRKHTYRTAYSNADTDGDGKITSIDLSYLKRYVLRLISSFRRNVK